MNLDFYDKMRTVKTEMISHRFGGDFVANSNGRQNARARIAIESDTSRIGGYLLLLGEKPTLTGIYETMRLLRILQAKCFG